MAERKIAADTEPLGAPDHNYLLRLTEDMAGLITDRATARSESWAVWIREAIRQRLERDSDG